MLRKKSQPPQLPDHLWRYVCRFLTDEQVRGMYAVNRPLYRISMALRYREVEIGRLVGVGSEDTAKCLGLPKELRAHVRSLRFTATHLGPSDRPLPESDDDLIAGAVTASSLEAATKRISQLAIVRRVASHWRAKAQSPTSPTAPQSQFPPPPIPTPTSAARTPTVRRSLSLSRRKTREQTVRDQLLSDFEKFLWEVRNLTDLTIHYPDPRPEAIPGEAWSVGLLPEFGSGTPYASTLRSLTLSGSITTWKAIIPPRFEWPALERLSVRADMHFPNPNDDTYAIRLDLAPLVRRHAKTLKAVSFVSALDLDLTSLYDGVGWLPHLESLEIEQPYLPPSRNHTDALNQFLLRHRETLTSFKWSFVPLPDTNLRTLTPNAQDWFNQPPYHLTLPSLQRLHLTFPGPSNPGLFEGTLFYFARHASTLTHLSLNGLTFTLSQFHELLLLVGSKNIQDLDISLEILTSAVLTNLSTKFPLLKVLRLAYTSVGRQKVTSGSALVDPTAGGILKIPNVSMVKMWQFKQDMAMLILPGWAVEEVYLKRNVDREYKVDHVGKMVVKSLPKVMFVNGMYRETFLQL
ncbi:hypothetical protein P691DRAFT_700319 [Macrolepiota fuliginosa MF-IS2]|uniref:F-box domain-containing protein n=1 Tax=Macrolepiota fuliginosa MF-IS2 TaxID=1400762 RepID=A0A9P6C453_9AGAR|nr:hypothetical protein P691DRAFT_700319 [Macrolepiota fuliginosa MF-IS2]